MYLLTQDQSQALFTGDCIFMGGVGKFFEGTPAEMTDILQKRSQQVGDECLTFYGHDYGLKNLSWACYLLESIDKDSTLYRTCYQAYRECEQRKTVGFASTGIFWREERAHNLFIQSVLKNVGGRKGADGVQWLRQDKDRHDRLKQELYK